MAPISAGEAMASSRPTTTSVGQSIAANRGVASALGHAAQGGRQSPRIARDHHAPQLVDHVGTARERRGGQEPGQHRLDQHGRAVAEHVQRRLQPGGGRLGRISGARVSQRTRPRSLARYFLQNAKAI